MTDTVTAHSLTPDGRNTITVGAVGDVAFSPGLVPSIERHGLDWPFARIQAHLDRADLLFGNLESVFVPNTYPRDQLDPKGLIAPFAGEAVANALRTTGFDVVNLAQNHVLDAGEVGMLHTKRVLEDAGLVVGGVGRTQKDARTLVTKDCGALRLGFLCYCEDSNYTLGTRGPCHAYYTPQTVLEDIERHRPDVDILIVSVHADIEFMPTPSVPRLNAFRAFASAGADVVLGHHPHVPQGCEMVDGRLIAYSLGNFVTTARTSAYMKPHLPWTAQSFVLLIEVSQTGVRSFQRIPFEIGDPPEQRPIPLTGADRERFAKRLAELDACLQDEELLLSVWRDVAKRQLARYILESLRPATIGGPAWKRGLHRLLWHLGKRCVAVDTERVIEELVPRLCLTAENRSWMQEILCMGHEQWITWNQNDPDPFHRPAHRVGRR